MNDPQASPTPAPVLRILLWSSLGSVIGAVALTGAWSMLHRPPARIASQVVAGPVDGAAPARKPSRGAAGGAGLPSDVSTASGSSDALAGEPAPDFTLTDRTGRRVTRADLAGKVWIADFIFTRCATACPTLTREMSRMRDELSRRGAGEVVFVSFTVDPAFDTPEVLAEYAAPLHADPSAWLFLTGKPEDMLHLVKDGFHLMMNEPGEGPPMHSNRIVLVDALGRIRRSRLGTDEGLVQDMVDDTLAVLSRNR